MHHATQLDQHSASWGDVFVCTQGWLQRLGVDTGKQRHHRAIAQIEYLNKKLNATAKKLSRISFGG